MKYLLVLFFFMVACGPKSEATLQKISSEDVNALVVSSVEDTGDKIVTTYQDNLARFQDRTNRIEALRKEINTLDNTSLPDNPFDYTRYSNSTSMVGLNVEGKTFWQVREGRCEGLFLVSNNTYYYFRTFENYCSRRVLAYGVYRTPRMIGLGTGELASDPEKALQIRINVVRAFEK